MTSGMNGSMKDGQIAEEVERRVNAIFDEVDINNDGFISHAEFLWAMTGLETHLTENEEAPGAVGKSGNGGTGNKDKSAMVGRQYKSSPNLNMNRQKSDKGVIRHQRSMGAGPTPVVPERRSTLTAFRNALQGGIGGGSNSRRNSNANTAASSSGGEQSAESNDHNVNTLNDNAAPRKSSPSIAIDTNAGLVAAKPGMFAPISGSGSGSKNGSPSSQNGGTTGKSPVRKIPHASSARFSTADANDLEHDLPSAIEEVDEERGSVSGFSRHNTGVAMLMSIDSEKFNGAAVVPITSDRVTDRRNTDGELVDDEMVAAKRRSKEVTEGESNPTGNRRSRERALTAGSPALTPPNYTGILAHNQNKLIADTFVSS